MAFFAANCSSGDGDGGILYAGPFNLMSLLFPREMIVEVLIVIMMVKVGLIGVSGLWFFRKRMEMAGVYEEMASDREICSGIDIGGRSDWSSNCAGDSRLDVTNTESNSNGKLSAESFMPGDYCWAFFCAKNSKKRWGVCLTFWGKSGIMEGWGKYF